MKVHMAGMKIGKKHSKLHQKNKLRLEGLHVFLSVLLSTWKASQTGLLHTSIVLVAVSTWI